MFVCGFFGISIGLSGCIVMFLNVYGSFFVIVEVLRILLIGSLWWYVELVGCCVGVVLLVIWLCNYIGFGRLGMLIV